MSESLINLGTEYKGINNNVNYIPLEFSVSRTHQKKRAEYAAA